MPRNSPSFGLVPFLTLGLALLVGEWSSLAAQGTSHIRNSPAIVATFRPVVARASDSTVRLLSDSEEVCLGTVVSADGLILTKASELRGSLAVKLKDGRTFTARLVGMEDRHDVALLKINVSGLKPIEWQASNKGEVGNWVAAPGLGQDPVAIGVVSVAVRRPSAMEMPKTAPKANSGYLGVMLEPGERGLPTIGRITSGSPAEKAGLKVGDVVLNVAGRTVASTERLISTIQGFRPGQVVSIVVKRGEEEHEVSARLSRFPLDILSRGERMNMMGSELSHRLGGFPTILQHDMLIKPSDCGGPIVDLEGKALGINIARAGRTESYALPSEVIQGLIPEMKGGKFVVKDDSSEQQIAQMESSLRRLRTSLTKAQEAMASLAEDATKADRKKAEERVTELKAKITKTQAELGELRKARASK
ncbi:MAG: PDZ domain-containing protein [Gemmataceae bacterium]